MRYLLPISLFLLLILTGGCKNKGPKLQDESKMSNQQSNEAQFEGVRNDEMQRDLNGIQPIDLSTFTASQVSKVREHVIVNFTEKKVMSREMAAEKGYKLIDASENYIKFKNNEFKLEVSELELVIDKKRVGDGRRLGTATYSVKLTSSKTKEEREKIIQMAFLAYIEESFVEVFEVDASRTLK